MTSATDEFRAGWRIVLGAALGCGLGLSGLLTYTSGLFLPALQAETGLTRGQFGTVFFGTTVALALVVPFWGRLVDRVGTVPPALFGSAMLVIGFLALALLTRSVETYAIVMIATGLLAAGSSPVAYTRAVSAAFDRARGLALGLTQVGIGVSAATIPPVTGLIMAAHGWRAGYLFLAVAAAAGLLPTLVFLRRQADKRLVARESTTTEPPFRSPTFRLQFAAFFMMAAGFAGLLPHFVPMLVDAGVRPVTAAAYAGVIGMSVIASRVLVGWLADRMNAPLLAAGACAICALGLLTVAAFGADAAPVAAVALGCAMGAEADLIGFMTARYFGVTVYGRAYGVQYAGFMVAAGLGPMWVGYAADWSGSYRLPCLVAAGLLGVAILLFRALPSTRVHTELSSEEGDMRTA